MTNIIVVGVNFSGIMAGSQRINNLFKPLLQKEDIRITNLVINDKTITDSSGKILFKELNYNIYNPFSVLCFIFHSLLYPYIKFDRKTLNIVYHYGYPNIENLIFLKMAKLIGFKIVFDIVELNRGFDQSKSRMRMRFKNYTSQRLLNQIYKTGSLCFAISSELVDYCRAICKNRIPVVHLPISVDVEYVHSFKNNNKDNAKIRIFYGGSFGLKDGVNLLLKGFEAACESNSEIELVLTGKISKQMDGIIQDLISESKWNTRINYMGCLSVSEYFETMVNSEILCMTRINTAFANAGFPFKLGEYLASGNAIIATDVGDVSKYLENRYNAILIKPDSEIAIHDAIIMLCSDNELRNKIGMCAKETAKKYFSNDLVSAILLSNLSSL